MLNIFINLKLFSLHEHRTPNVQRQFCITITGAYKKTNYLKMLSECGLETLESRRNLKKNGSNVQNTK